MRAGGKAVDGGQGWRECEERSTERLRLGEGVQALHWASYMGRSLVVELLLRIKADIGIIYLL